MLNTAAPWWTSELGPLFKECVDNFARGLQSLCVCSLVPIIHKLPDAAQRLAVLHKRLVAETRSGWPCTHTSMTHLPHHAASQRRHVTEHPQRLPRPSQRHVDSTRICQETQRLPRCMCSVAEHDSSVQCFAKSTPNTRQHTVHMTGAPRPPHDPGNRQWWQTPLATQHRRAPLHTCCAGAAAGPCRESVLPPTQGLLNF